MFRELVCFCVLFSVGLFSDFGWAQEKPNIVWLVCEDQSPEFFPMYGNSDVSLPHLEALAEQSVIYANMYATTPVCSPARSAIITGRYPTSMGTHNMRAYNEGRSQNQPQLNIPSYSPKEATRYPPFPIYLKPQGYYCSNAGKEDYNFKIDESTWEASCNYCSGEKRANIHWRSRENGQAFFSVFNFQITHEAQIWEQAKQPLLVAEDNIEVPPYFPYTPVVRKDLAVNYSNLIRMDRQIGKIIAQLKEDGLYDNAYIFFYSDHGGPFPRYKRAIYETGTKVPFMIKYPKSKYAGKTVNDLLSFIDLAPTVLGLAGVEKPKQMLGVDFINNAKCKREYLVTASDRFDGQLDQIRAIRDKRFKLILNSYTDRAHHLPVKYRMKMPLMVELLRVYKAGGLNANQEKWFQVPKAEAEFYDLEKDPFEFNNLINEKRYSKKINDLKQYLAEWKKRTKDLSHLKESYFFHNIAE